MMQKNSIFIATIVILSLAVLAVLFNLKNNTSNPNTSTNVPSTTIENSPLPTPIKHTSLAINPNSINMKPNETKSIDVLINTQDQQITAVQLELKYNPQFITNVQIAPGSMFTQKPFILNLLNKNNPNIGQITYAFGISPTQHTLQGNGVVATITFTAKSLTTPQTMLQILPTSIITAKGFTNSVLRNTAGAVITIK